MLTPHEFNLSPAAHDGIAIILDGVPVEVPATRRSLNSIRCYLETLALGQQRVICALSVDGRATNLTQPPPVLAKFSHVEASSVSLDDSSLLVLKTAWQQSEQARECVETALTLVLINDSPVACELWWNIARLLKEPILTLSYLPDHLCGPANGRASLKQLRKWQLEQVAVIICDVDQACQTCDTIEISNALENRVLPWLEKLHELILLWHDTELARARLGLSLGTF